MCRAMREWCLDFLYWLVHILDEGIIGFIISGVTIVVTFALIVGAAWCVWAIVRLIGG